MNKKLIIRDIEDVKDSYKETKHLLDFPFDSLNVEDIKEIINAFGDTINNCEYLISTLEEELELKDEDVS